MFKPAAPDLNGKERPIMGRVLKFQKATPTQAKLKLGLYGPQGSGKTLTSLLVAEGLAARENKRIAFIDTEQGYSFYSIEIPERRVHPAGFDFDVYHTRSIMDALELAQNLDSSIYGVLILDSVTHFWQAAIEAYSGARTSRDTIPFQAWGAIKRPYKKLMEAFLNGDFHAILCGREGKEVSDTEDGSLKIIGTKIKAEGETGYEPHILVHMTNVRDDQKNFHVEAYFEKDRSGILAGKSIRNPNFATFESVLNYLSGVSTQGHVETADEAGAKDATEQADVEEKIGRERQLLFESIHAKLTEAKTIDELKTAWAETKGKKRALGDFFDQLQTVKDHRRNQLRDNTAAEAQV